MSRKLDRMPVIQKYIAFSGAPSGPLTALTSGASAPAWPSVTLVSVTLLAGALAAGGSAAINCWFDRDIDVKMDRTRNRPLPAGRMAPGEALSFGVTLPHVTDTATISKAELVVKNLSLKVEATSNVTTAVLTLYDANSGAFIGTMTNSGLSGGGAKYSFQGTIPSKVTTLRVKSSFNGTSTFAVAQK